MNAKPILPRDLTLLPVPLPPVAKITPLSAVTCRRTGAGVALALHLGHAALELVRLLGLVDLGPDLNLGLGLSLGLGLALALATPALVLCLGLAALALGRRLGLIVPRPLAASVPLVVAAPRAIVLLSVVATAHLPLSALPQRPGATQIPGAIRAPRRTMTTVTTITAIQPAVVPTTLLTPTCRHHTSRGRTEMANVPVAVAFEMARGKSSTRLSKSL